MDTTHGSIISSSQTIKCLSSLYGLAVRLRNILYDIGLLKIHHTPPVVISVGNIEAGGTGKTPFTIALAGRLKSAGYHVAILTRGYKGRLKGTVLVRPDHRAQDVGDEALLMALTSGVPVIKSPDRVAGALFAYHMLGTRIVIMDDGFQHRRIHRDLDIVLVAEDVHTDTLLPLGRLREPATSLERADIIVRTKGSSSSEPSAELVPDCFVDAEGNINQLSDIQGKKILAVCGIARPENFFSVLKSLGAVVEEYALPDHHNYTIGDIRLITYRGAGAWKIITTEKDMVKFREHSPDKHWLALRVTMHVPEMERIIQQVETIEKRRRIP